MIETNLDAISQARQAPPLALIFTSRLLLAEKAAIPDDGRPWGSLKESLAIRATLLTPILKGAAGHRHGGIND